jgi:DNA-binding transcriptional LysR family regulator
LPSAFPITSQNVVHTVSQVLTMLWLIAGGQGIASVPASASSLAIAGVTLRPIEGLPLNRSSCTCFGAVRPATWRCTQFSTAYADLWGGSLSARRHTHTLEWCAADHGRTLV